jgi:hypothetical protein
MFRSPDANERQRPIAADTHASAEKIDVTRYIDELEHTLRSDSNAMACDAALAILRRWQLDEMLTDKSCVRAMMLLREFGEIDQAKKRSNAR